MKPQRHHLWAVAFLCSLASLAWGLNYQYFSNIETTRLGGRVKFWHLDTLDGPVRSNSEIAIMQDPVFNDFVISWASDFWHGSSFNPQFTTYPPYFNADSGLMPPNANWIRDAALAQNHCYVGDDSLLARVRLEDHNLHVWWLRRFAPFDTLLETDVPLSDSAIVFFDFPQVNLFGTLHSILILGARGRVGLEDNVLYASADPVTGRAPAGHAEKFCLVAENDIKVLNTVANGLENSAGLGMNQTNPDLTGIVLDGFYVSLRGSFTFENQNDPDSGYVCTCQPDDRGQLHLYGSLYQYQRGYTHRTNRGSTGYVLHHRYDPDLKFWFVPLGNLSMPYSGDSHVDRTLIDFGAVALGDTARDTLSFHNGFVPVYFASDTLAVASPFMALRTSDPWGAISPWSMHARFALTFVPTAPGTFETALVIPLPYYDTTLTVTLRGTCTASGIAPHENVLPQAFTLSASPNPFNATTQIAFTLPVGGNVLLRVYDLLGREQATLAQGGMAAGTHDLVWDASALPGGLYFVRLSTSSQDKTTKLLLLK